jgi:hypothetical protein
MVRQITNSAAGCVTGDATEFASGIGIDIDIDIDIDIESKST